MTRLLRRRETVGVQTATSATIVYYHGNNWDGVPARQRYLMSALAARFQIIYLDGFSTCRWKMSVTEPQSNVTVINGLIPIVRRLERRGLKILARFIFRQVLFRQLCSQNHIICWAATPAFRFDHFVRSDVLVYDCIDPTFDEETSGILRYKALEAEVLRIADVVLATASALVEDCLRVRKDIALVPNACEPSEYTPDLLATAARPIWFPNGDRPVAAYLGSIDWRIDRRALEIACRDNPDIDFVIAGNVIPEFANFIDTLSALPNVVCPGRITVESGRYLLAHCDVGLIPFRPSAMNDRINPVKMYAYALLGKPIAGTNIGELLEYSQIVCVSTGIDPSYFSEAVRRALSEVSNEASARLRKDFALRNTWTERATQVESILMAAIAAVKVQPADAKGRANAS
jgi:glycosyltransferase involved in cell wall biosynthesis